MNNAKKLIRNKNRHVFIGLPAPCPESGPSPEPIKKVNNKPIKPYGRRIQDMGRALLGARNWAQFDKTNPFALNTAMAHIKSGVAGPWVDEKDNPREGIYDAQQSLEERKLIRPNGDVEKYNVVVFVNGKRP